MTWIEGRRMTPRTGASPQEVDRQLGWPHVQARRVENSCDVSWAFPNGVPDFFPETWEWRVERSGSPGGPFTPQSKWLPSSETLWRDDAIPLGRENTRRPYYRLELRFPDGEVRTVGYRPEWDAILPGDALHGFTWEEWGIRSAYSPPVVRETRRRFDILARNYTRSLVALYREAWLEGPCDVCIDGQTGERIGAPDGGPCTACFETGKHGGYYTPLRFQVMRHDAGTLQPQDIPQGTHDLEETSTLIAPFWPIPEPRDIIRFGNGSLFVISGVSHQDHHDYPVVHVIQASQIPRTHVLSTIPLPTVIDDAAAGPRRQHGRAMNLEAFQQSLSGGAMARAGATLPESPEQD